MSRARSGADHVARDLRHVWHPFTHHGLWGTASDPIAVIVRAEGNELIDAEGHRYLDAISSLWCNTLGHRVPEIDQAKFQELAKAAKDGCPISKLLKAEITLEANLR